MTATPKADVRPLSDMALLSDADVYSTSGCTGRRRGRRDDLRWAPRRERILVPVNLHSNEYPRLPCHYLAQSTRNAETQKLNGASTKPRFDCAHSGTRTEPGSC